MTGPLRAIGILSAFLGLTLPLMPIQYALVRLGSPWARRLPNWYHRQVCRLIGVRIHCEGEIPRGRPVLVVANHVSWLDIPVLSAVAPVSFIAKKEVGRWPFIGSLARLQRTVFVDRERRLSVGDTASEMLTRLRTGDNLILFAEGTSNDGNRVLPFRSSLFAAVEPGRHEDPDDNEIAVQTLAIAYTGRHGIALDRFDRPGIAWYGDMEIAGHAWELLKAGPLDVEIIIGAPVSLAQAGHRKLLARRTETEVRNTVARLLRECRRAGQCHRTA
ncbi:MAG: 1-acyl-sn-glycerol-3-phosphate acyltransferase [Hyphomicrobiaceae bacterium]|nr:MAG: 1-acyl-sn-glycerol-3-phosphate acyltransferase [Hyphomicrobiaceae bacterium]